MLKLHTFSCLVAIYDLVCLFDVKIIGLSSLEVSFLFEFLISAFPPSASLNPTSLPSPFFSVVYLYYHLSERV
jgi:hypothetical protein